MVACLSANGRKISAQERLPIRLHGQCQDDIVCVRIKSAVRRAINTQARDSVVCLGWLGWLTSDAGEEAGHENCAVGLHDNC